MKRVFVLTIAMCFIVTVTSLGAAAAPQCFGKKATIKGTAGKDKLTGTKSADVIVGLGGNDKIFGGGGSDLICGGDGNDELLGEKGNDRITGEGGKDVLSFKTSPTGVTVDLDAGSASGQGTDTFEAVETLTGSNHDDTLRGDKGNNPINGLEGNDTIEGRDGDDIQKSGPGNDTITGGAGSDSHYGGPGNDVMDGTTGTDAVAFKFSDAPVTADMATGAASGEGDDEFTNMDIIVGSHLGDTLTGGNGDDAFYALGGNDIVDGRGGFDQIIYVQSPAGVTVDLSTGSASGGEGADDLTSIEIVVGSAFADTITGDANGNNLIGLAGDDTLDGGAGYDYLDGGDGTDSCVNGESDSYCE